MGSFAAYRATGHRCHIGCERGCMLKTRSERSLSPKERLEQAEQQIAELQDQVAELNKFAWKAAGIIRSLRTHADDDLALRRKDIESRISERENRKLFRTLRFFFKP
jgi:hypothetical protein